MEIYKVALQVQKLYLEIKNSSLFSNSLVMLDPHLMCMDYQLCKTHHRMPHAQETAQL